MSRETIAAVSTAPGRGGVAVVRVSGDGAFGVGRTLTGREMQPGRIMVRRVLGEECVVLAFATPHSYTGEDVVEFQCHGGIVAPRRILDAALRAGSRMAGRGEFTQRAFLNGRITYEGAKSVIDLIDAKTDRAAEAALAGIAGQTTQLLRTCYDEAIDISSRIEHSLDIDEGELPGDFSAGVESSIRALLVRLENAARELRTRSLMRTGALVVLAGPPNAGKSSLFNALVKENRAIVSPTAGTTRDAIEAWLDIAGWPVRLVDTAGLRQSADAIEAEGVRRSEEYISRAEVVCILRPADGDAAAEDAQRGAAAAAILRICTKCDLARSDNGLNVSAKTGEGLDELRNAIAAALEAKAQSNAPDAIDADEDATGVIFAAEARLYDALASVGDLVIAGNAVRSAAETLGRHIGAEYSADMLDRLFSRFCVGK